jgi:hypothetical protein
MQNPVMMPAQPTQVILSCQLVIRADNALAGLTADSHLADHNAQADKHCQYQVHEKEREAAALAHLVREAPDVAQTDC